MNITKEQVEHIATLAKLNIEESAVLKYQEQLGDILNEIEKIMAVNIDEDIMISPSSNRNNYSSDIIGTHISRKDAFKNAKRVMGDYIVVPKVVE
ncbi:MAG: Asp-tRNA(Asn)/Glu-tRNA(Gln) amidotransferase subunit GatC [Bacilli bacterium]